MINPFKRTYSEKEHRIFRFLGRIPLFEKLTSKEKSYFIPYLHLREYKQNEVVFFRKDPSHALYIVKEGQVSLQLDIEDKFEELVRLRSGRSFGDNTLLEGTHRIYSAICTVDKTEIYVLPQVNILDIFNEHPRVQAKMMSSLSEQYNIYQDTLFKAYRSSFGFFDLGQIYIQKKK
ncbi:Crp/Fnr family transcriptional regulator [Roseivirga sp. BDSF3-8]|uniref:Crp/Fnr family transcriptional regulator n=1 Tax=Roseivirga sp. BDSF3-8 TaxID=3241598 RepID=UPI0035325256